MMEVNLCEISVTSFRGQFDAFLMADNFHFVCNIFHFLTLLFGVILSLLGQLFQGKGGVLRSILGVTNVN